MEVNKRGNASLCAPNAGAGGVRSAPCYRLAAHAAPASSRLCPKVRAKAAGTSVPEGPQARKNWATFAMPWVLMSRFTKEPATA